MGWQTAWRVCRPSCSRITRPFCAAALIRAAVKAGVLSLIVMGQRTSEETKRGLEYLSTRPPGTRDGHMFYGFYYCTQAMYQLGDNYWNVYRPQLYEALLRTQRTNGSWDGESIGPDYGTAMAVLALTVDYGFLPIYQRGDESPGGTGKASDR